MPLRPYRLPLAAAGLAAALLSLTACGNEPPTPVPSGPAATAGASPASPGTSAAAGFGAAPTGGTATSGAPGATREAAVLGDGRWPAFVTKAGDGELTMDLVEFLTGEAAVQAWQKKYPDSSEKTPPNDYVIVNDNPRKRDLPLAKTVTVKVVGSTGGVADRTITVAELRKRLPDPLFWLTVENGRVTRIEEQYLP